jgi:hypothetical protein
MPSLQAELREPLLIPPRLANRQKYLSCNLVLKIFSTPDYTRAQFYETSRYSTAKVVYRQLSTAVIYVRTQVRSGGIRDGQSGAGASSPCQFSLH